jgi:hypothetical protein
VLVFWASSAALLSAAFIFSSEPANIYSNRYLVGLTYAVAVIIPIVLSGRVLTEALAVAGTFLVALSGTIQMGQGTVLTLADAPGMPSDAVMSRVAQIATQQHLSVGYAGYWDAAPITWATHARVHVYPVWPCQLDPRALCDFFVHTISSWYVPRPNLRTFVLVDPSCWCLATRPPELGPPVATYHIAEMTMYVYPYDVALEMHSNPFDP